MSQEFRKNCPDRLPCSAAVPSTSGSASSPTRQAPPPPGGSPRCAAPQAISGALLPPRGDPAPSISGPKRPRLVGLFLRRRVVRRAAAQAISDSPTRRVASGDPPRVSPAGLAALPCCSPARLLVAPCSATGRPAERLLRRPRCAPVLLTHYRRRPSSPPPTLLGSRPALRRYLLERHRLGCCAPTSRGLLRAFLKASSSPPPLAAPSSRPLCATPTRLLPQFD